jgi:hypothetical protein
MVGQNSEVKVEAEGEMECALNPKRSQYLRRSGRGEEGAGSTVPDVPRFPRIVCTYKKATAVVVTADRGSNRRDMLLTHASLPHTTT